MSQHDFDIVNQTASSARSDINNALQALASNNSLATAPSTPYEKMWWYDTSNNILKSYKGSGTWINVGRFNQTTNEFEILDNTKVVTTSGSQAGLLGDQTTATWQAGTGTTESLVSPAKVLAAIEENSITQTSGSAPYYGCRAFVFIEDGSDASNTWTGQNIASVVRTSTGAYTVTFTTAMPNANYAIAIGPSSQGAPNNGYGMAIGFTAKSASSFSVRTRRVTDHDIFDCDQMSFSVFT